MSVLAIDAGTTGVTALVVTAEGRIAARGRQELAQHFPGPGRVEHVPEEIWQATLGACRQAVAGADATELAGIGIANRRETVVLWDRETLGSPRRAIGWADRRTAALCDDMASHEERIRELTGLQLDPRFSATKLAWLRENEPHTWALVESGRYAVGTVDSYLIARMTRGLEHVTDVSNAARTLLLGLTTGDWSDELCGLFGVPRDALPELVANWGASLMTDRRSFLDLSLPIAGMAGDPQAALVGQACFEVGDSTYTHGTDSFVLTNTGASLERSGGRLCSTAAWRSPDGELAYALEGAIVGVTGSTAAHLDRAALEAIAFEVRGVMASAPVPLSSLRVDRGAPDLLCQLQADQLGIEVLRSEHVETAALGAAFLAGLGTGVWDSFDSLRDIWPLDRSFTPDARR